MGLNHSPMLTVRRHGIFLNADGLSDFQEQLLSSPSMIRMGVAPTGCGKTFAFIRAVEKGQRILFVVPTRRLGQNIIRGLYEDLQRIGWSAEKIAKKIALWSSDGRALMVEQGVKNPTQKRLQDITMLSFAEGGEFIVATPESLSWLVLDPRRFPLAGVTDQTVIEVIARFDHVVFDEMHTITEKSFSQCLIMARLATKNPDLNCKITLLSATPLETSGAMACFDIAKEQIAIIKGDIYSTSEGERPDLRIIHGDVGLHLVPNTGLHQLLEQNRDTVMSEVKAGRSIILVYDELYGGLTKDLDAIGASLDKMNIPPEDRLLISSADDSSQNAKGHKCFCSGRDKEPSNYKVLVCTSSVEVGVTYKTRLMMIEPGHSEASFLQRFGRVARGDINGHVYVSVSDKALCRHAWLKRLQCFVTANNGKSIDVQELTDNLTQDVSHLFKTQKKQNPFASQANWFGQMPERAAAIGGLAWCFMMDHHGIKKERKTALLNSAPPIAKEIYGLLRRIEVLGSNPQYTACVATWRSTFLNEVMAYRSIGEQVKVVYPKGSHTLSLKGVMNNTSILDRFDLTYDDNGGLQVFIDADSWRDYSSDHQHRYSDRGAIVWPHTDRQTSIEKNRAVKTVARKLIAEEIKKANPNSPVLNALQAVETIHRRSGLLCVIQRNAEVVE